MQICSLTPGGYGKAKQFLKDVWNGLFGKSEDEFLRNYFNDPDTLKDLDDVQKTYLNNKGTFLIAIEDDKIIATGALVKVNEDVCELTRMFVHPDHRRLGIAKAISNLLLEFAEQNGYKKIILGSNRQLIASHNLYRNLGFKEIDPSTAEIGKYAIFMEKVLNNQ